MRYILAVLAVLLMVGVAFGGYGPKPGDVPACPPGERAYCVANICSTTTMGCFPAHRGYYENGEWHDLPYEDCNKTTCDWRCWCEKVPNFYNMDLVK